MFSKAHKYKKKNNRKWVQINIKLWNFKLKWRRNFVKAEGNEENTKVYGI